MGSLKDSFFANIQASGFDPENEEHVKTVLELGAFAALGASIVIHAYDQLVAAKGNSDRKYWAEEIVNIQSDIKELLEMSGRGVVKFNGNESIDAYADLLNHTGSVN